LVCPRRARRVPPSPQAVLHRSAFGQTYAGLAAVDVTFHTTLVLAAAVVMLFFVRAILSPVAAAASGTAVEPALPAV